MEQPTCKAPGCNELARSRKADLCAMHYHRVYRHGTLGIPARHPEKDLTGRRFGSLVVQSYQGAGSWLCLCDCGACIATRAGALNRGSAKTCGNRAIHYRRADVGYPAAHDRVRQGRGSASGHACVDCAGPAAHWSYDHRDPDELLDDGVKYGGVKYSANVDHYEPRCVPCHKRFDLRWLAAG